MQINGIVVKKNGMPLGSSKNYEIQEKGTNKRMKISIDKSHIELNQGDEVTIEVRKSTQA